ncbi:MAG: type II toxin-antitoxin system Phd/YefM family antitoxin, partial [Planctomycetes bacterium]|nr:type II toxin-antitoxin system Phd/YefM family antitoxin [Planctomycetota bacterium]
QFKVHASRLIRELGKTKRPLVITQNGRPAAVLITPEDFDQLTDRQRFLEAIQRGLDAQSQGAVLSHADVIKRLEAEFGELTDETDLG